MTVALQGDFGKGRPALVVQSKKNGLRVPCQIGVDKAFTVKREKISSVIGEIEQKTMLIVDRAMSVFWGLA